MLGTQGPAAGAFLLLAGTVGALAVTGAPVASAADGPDAGADPAAAERLLYRLEYVAADYDYAVREGAIADAYEYVEMVRLAQALLDGAGELQRHGAGPDTRAELELLLDLILARRPYAEVDELSRGLIRRLFAELDSTSLPATPPDLRRGRALYAADCAPCHGPSGAGDGRAAADMRPPPTSFRDARMNRIAPHQVWAATVFGIEGTAMPSFDVVRSHADVWSIAFFVMTLREDFAPRPPEQPLTPSIEELAISSNAELLERLRAARPGVEAAHVDFLRLMDPPAGP